MTVPLKHHYVPQFLLKRFADSNKKLLVHRTDAVEKPRWAPVKKTAQTLGGHTLYWPGRDPDHTSMEAGMGSIEEATAKVVASLLATTVRAPSDQQREVLGFFIALQWQRSRFLIDLTHRTIFDPDEPVDERSKSIAVRSIQRTVLFPWFARRDGEIDPSETSCFIPDFLRNGPWSWRLYRPTGPKLIVGDTVACMWGVAADAKSTMTEAWAHHGVAVGFGTCGRVTMPLAPNLGLIIHRNNRPDLRTLDAAEFNRATIYNSREFVAHHTNWQPDFALRQALLDDLWTQRQILPIIIEATRSAAEKEAREITERLRQMDSNPPFF